MRARTVATIGTTQMVAWASSYYLPAIVADPIASELRLSRSLVFGVFSGALLLSAALGPMVGRAIDRRGGRDVLALSNLALAAGLAGLATARGLFGLGAAWALVGFGMALGLFDAAFATVTGLYGRGARRSIAGITLIAGFASTIAWPASALLEETFGWRVTCLGWAVVNLVICFPLNRLVIPKPDAPPTARAQATAPISSPIGMVLLAFVFAAAAFVSGSMAAHLPRLLEMAGTSPPAAVAIASLIGPAQVVARLLEFGLLQHLHPLFSAAFSVGLHPLGVALLAVLGTPGAIAFSVFHGAGNGLLAIARGTVPLALFGPAGYGLRTGLLAVPARLTIAVSPLIFGLLLDAIGFAAVIVTGALSLAALASLALLRVQPVEAPVARAGT